MSGWGRCGAPVDTEQHPRQQEDGMTDPLTDRTAAAEYALRAVRVWTPGGWWRCSRQDSVDAGHLRCTYAYTGPLVGPDGIRVSLHVTAARPASCATRSVDRPYVDLVWTVYASATRAGARIDERERSLRLAVVEEQPQTVTRVVGDILTDSLIAARAWATR